MGACEIRTAPKYLAAPEGDHPQRERLEQIVQVCWKGKGSLVPLLERRIYLDSQFPDGWKTKLRLKGNIFFLSCIRPVKLAKVTASKDARKQTAPELPLQCQSKSEGHVAVCTVFRDIQGLLGY